MLLRYATLIFDTLLLVAIDADAYGARRHATPALPLRCRYFRDIFIVAITLMPTLKMLPPHHAAA